MERECSANAIDRAGAGYALSYRHERAFDGTYLKHAGEVFGLTPAASNDEFSDRRSFVSPTDEPDLSLVLIASWALGDWD